MSVTCPSCGNNDTQRLSTVYKSGLSVVSSKITAQTAASLHASPPRKKRYRKPLAIIFGVSITLELIVIFYANKNKVEILGNNILGCAIMSMIWVAASAGWCIYAYHYNRKIWPQLRAVWGRSFLCNHCHTIFELPLITGRT